jgi:hypothetical protein
MKVGYVPCNETLEFLQREVTMKIYCGTAVVLGLLTLILAIPGLSTAPV